LGLIVRTSSPPSGAVLAERMNETTWSWDILDTSRPLIISTMSPSFRRGWHLSAELPAATRLTITG
jgi:hypothetical protein